MAISNDLPGLEVEIIVDDEALKEYRDDVLVEEDRTTTRYIEAVSGRTFAVRFKTSPGFRFMGQCLNFDIYVDGDWVDSLLILRRTQATIRTSEGRDTNGGRALMKYCFGTLETVSDGRIGLLEPNQVKKLGTIQIVCVHKNCTKAETRREASKLKLKRKSRREPDFVSEKAIKGQAVSHRVEFQAPTSQKPSNLWDTTDVLGVPNPAATFIFHYRSLASLKSMLIIPRTPSPPPLEERDIDELSRDEMRELQRRANEFRKHKEDQVKIKREKSEDSPLKRKRSQPRASDTQLEVDEEGIVRECSPVAPREREVIELD